LVPWNAKGTVSKERRRDGDVTAQKR